VYLPADFERDLKAERRPQVVAFYCQQFLTDAGVASSGLNDSLAAAAKRATGSLGAESIAHRVAGGGDDRAGQLGAQLRAVPAARAARGSGPRHHRDRRDQSELSRRIVQMLDASGAVMVSLRGGYTLSRSEAAPPIVGVVRITEIRVALEGGGQLTAINVRKGERARAGDVVAELSALELTASVAQERAALDVATASRDHVYAGVRAEEVEALAAGIEKDKAKLEYAQAQLTRTASLAQSDTATQQALHETQNDIAAARADVAEAQANHEPRSLGGPGRSVRLPIRRLRSQRPRSPCSSGAWTKPSCARQPTASSP
jgi:hypothetical protein